MKGITTLMALIRADKFLASCMGITRTEAKKAIKQKRFTSDSGIIISADNKIDSNLSYYFDHRPIQYEEFSYFLFHKPAGCVSATKDNLHKTVLDFMPTDYKELFPVGRLDLDTTGLMLITNDGQLAHDLLSPTKHIAKTYEATIDGIVDALDVKLFLDGFDYGEKKISKSAQLQIISTDLLNQKSLIHLTLTEGKFHQVKRMFLHINKPVLSLKRIGFGPFTLEDSLIEGSYRKLTNEEIQLIKEN